MGLWCVQLDYAESRRPRGVRQASGESNWELSVSTIAPNFSAANIAANSEAPFLEDSGAEVIQRAMWVSDGQKLAKKWRSRRIGEIRDCTKGKESLRSFRNPGTPSYRTRLSGIKSSNGHELVSVQNCTLFGHSPLR